MSRKLPLCAWCGLPLRGKSSVRLHFGIDGRPEVAWHWAGCEDCDPLAKKMRTEFNKSPDERRTLQEILGDIDKRGPGRLVTNKIAAKRSETKTAQLTDRPVNRSARRKTR